MASSEIPPPQLRPSAQQDDNDSSVIPPSESEPLLGRPGDAVQKPDAPMIQNLWLGTGWIAQIGSILLLALIWAGVFTHQTLPLVSPHPLLQSLGVLAVVQAILILQPTTTPDAKRLGQRAHATLHLLSFLLFLSGITVIETNKHVNHMDHLHSVHGYLGVISGTLMLAQYVFGFCMWALPGLFGGEAQAKALWKYHRYGGYALLVMLLATVGSAMHTPYNVNVLGIKQWAVWLAVVLILIGVFPRIQLRKLGFHRA